MLEKFLFWLAKKLDYKVVKLDKALEGKKFFTFSEVGKLVNPKSRNGMFLAQSGIDMHYFYRPKKGDNKNKIRLKEAIKMSVWRNEVFEPAIGDILITKAFADFLYNYLKKNNEKQC